MSDNNKNALAGSIVGLVSLIATAAFLLIGFTSYVWHPTWLVFFAIPIASILTDITIRKRGAAGAVTGVVSLLAAVVFFILGFKYGRWHPGWLVFFAVPISDLLMKIFTKAKEGSCCDKSNSCTKE